jgi:phosphoribosylformylglycinamidine synthase subunit PurL
LRLIILFLKSGDIGIFQSSSLHDLFIFSFIMALDFFSEGAAKHLEQYQISLTLTEAQDLQKQLGRPMTLTEAVIFGIQLSEHCSYKSSRNFLKTLPTTGKNVVLGPSEDAGVVEVFEHAGEKYCIAVGHESHNHPSQVVPYEGAATGIGGIVRDILCMGARPVGVLDQLRLGDMGKSIPKNIARGVVEGIAGYGNPLGVPNMGGDVYFDAGFDENCLVNVTAFGVLRASDLIHSFVPKNAAAEKWDLIIVGKPTDNSGFGGASFASGSFESDDDLESKKAAVQQPNPFLERHLVASILDLIQDLKSEGDFEKIALKDLGAGGVLCATVEISQGGGFGAEINLDNLHTIGEYPPHVIACSETQERFCFACHPDLSEKILNHFNQKWELGKVAAQAGASRVGHIREDGQYRVSYAGELLCDAPAKLITEGILYDRPYEIAKKEPVKTVVDFVDGMICLES